ncbi:hypothetical protein TIFTF001_003025 [Ficus carica]|uniref:Uncharacterized protein n=1 Tax=Ficus carica TaxID=3494 RepID=A0AA87ZXR7_FICCA|nr:hypothetical protein TIFTF001_003025 [Ficus carica]
MTPALYQFMSEHTNHVFDEIDEKPLVDSPLHMAAASGKTHFALELMRLKPSFAKKLNPRGFRPLHLALQEGHSGTVLRQVDADKELIRVQGKVGKTPLHHVAEHENLDQDVFLSACPTSFEDVTNRRQTALHLASEKGKFKSVEIILKWCNKGLRSTERKDGNTALHIDIKEILTRAGALNAVSVPERECYAILIKFRRRQDELSLRWNVGNYLICRYKANMTNDKRYVLLIVAVLIIAMLATYHTSLNTPLGSARQGKNDATTSIGDGDVTFARILGAS